MNGRSPTATADSCKFSLRRAQTAAAAGLLLSHQIWASPAVLGTPDRNPEQYTVGCIGLTPRTVVAWCPLIRIQYWSGNTKLLAGRHSQAITAAPATPPPPPSPSPTAPRPPLPSPTALLVFPQDAELVLK